MIGKSRLFALAGLMVALVAGTTAVRAWSRPTSTEVPGEVPSPCKAGARCAPGLVRKAPNINRPCSATRKKTTVKKVKEGKQDCCNLAPRTECSRACGVQQCKEEKKECCCPPGKPTDSCPCKNATTAATSSVAIPHPPCAPACVGPVCLPFPGCPVPPPYMQAPPPPPFHVFDYPGECKQYTVEMKLVESRKGESEKVVAMPRVTVCEGQSALVSAGISHAGLWEMNVPANDMGHEGHEINVQVNSAKPGQVCLNCAVWTSEMDYTHGGSKILAEGKISTACCVKLGETTKVHCDRVYGKEKVSCRLEITVKECCIEDENNRVECPKVEVEDCFVGYDGCHMLDGGPLQATWCAPAPRPMDDSVNCPIVSITAEETPMKECGKQADLQGACKHLRVCTGGATMTVEKTELELVGRGAMKVSLHDDRVKVECEDLTAVADQVSTEKDGSLVLSGNVRVLSSKDRIEVKSGTVTVKPSK